VKQIYVTRGVNSTINLQLQLLIFALSKSSQVEIEKDYLQVFNLSQGFEDGKTVQVIKQSQEVREYERSLSFYCDKPVTAKLFMITDGDGDVNYETLLLADEY
jgi:uncharacterized protein (DUF2141 family)